VRIVIQRIKDATVTINGKVTSKSGSGLCVFLGIAKADTQTDAEYLAEKVAELRIFDDESGKMNRSLRETSGEVLVVSEFTLYGDCGKGRRPSFIQAAPPEEAESLYRHFIQKLQELGLKVATGTFQAKMEVSITNDGPVTFVLDSRGGVKNPLS
jgi:D-tyrosyl-tRNA(Tyr) deacylase